MIARDPLLSLTSFYVVRGVPLDVLAELTPARRGFLEGARALYYDEMMQVIQSGVAAGVAMLLGGGDRGG